MANATQSASTTTPGPNYTNMPLGEGKTGRTTAAQGSAVSHPNYVRMTDGAPPPKNIQITQDKIVTLVFNSESGPTTFSYFHRQKFNDIATINTFIPFDPNKKEDPKVLVLMPKEDENVSKIMTQLCKIWGQDTVSSLTTRGEGPVFRV